MQPTSNPTTPTTTPAQLTAAADWVARFAARWADLDPAALGELMHADTRNRIPPMTEPADRDGVIAHFARAQAMLGGLRLAVERWAASGDAVFVEWTASATVRGVAMTWRGIDRVLLRDGRTYAGEAFWDTRQLSERIAATAG